MTLLKRGTIKEYDAGAHVATVGIAGSLGVWLDDVPVHVGVRPADIVAGRECGVLFFTDDNPKDAVVVSVHGAVPAAIVTSIVKDADEDTKVDAEESTDEDKLRFDVSGNQRYLLQNASIHHQLTGDAYVNGVLHVGDGTTALGALNVLKTLGSYTSPNPAIAIDIVQTGNVPNANNMAAYTVQAAPTFSPAKDTSGFTLRGLNFFATGGGTGSWAESTAAQVRQAYAQSPTMTAIHGIWANATLSVGFSGTIAAAYGLRVSNQALAGTTNVYGVRVQEQLNATNRYGVYIEDLSGGTIARLLELVGALRVLGTGEYTPADGETPVYVGCDAAQTMNQITLGADNSGGAGYRVLRVPN
jgi:hypothetical protein